MKKHDRGGFLYAFNLTAVILILFFVALIPLLHAATTYAHTVGMQITASSTTSLYTQDSFTVSIDNASSTPLNAVEFELHYDPSKVFVTSVVPEKTLCEDRFIISNKIDNLHGTVLFQCGTVTPFIGTTGKIATVNAIPMQIGTSSFAFGTTTHVLASDGYGTDATKLVAGLSFAAF